MSAADYPNPEAENCNVITRLVFLEARNISAKEGANLVSCGGAGCVRFWNIQKGKLLAEFEAHSGVGPIIMTTDKRSQYLITADLVGWVKIWNIEDYCLTVEENTRTQAPSLIRSFQAHDDSITSLVSCLQNDCLFILSSSTDCSIVLTDISGVPFGIFGQEEHWRIGNYVPTFSKEENKAQTEKDNDVKEINPVHIIEGNACSNPIEQVVSVPEDKDSSMNMVSKIWKNTILGEKYREKTSQKGRKCIDFNRMAGIKPTAVFRSLKIEALQVTMDMSELDLFLHPDQSFGEKPAEKHSKDLKPPTLSAALKAAFDEKNLLPKEILDREKRLRWLREEMHHHDRTTSGRKQGKLK